MPVFKTLLFVLNSSSKYDEDRVSDQTPVTHLNCSLCLYLLYRPKKILRCGHIFCHSCIGNWFCLHKNCPLCRIRTSLSDISEPPEDIKSSLNNVLIKCKYGTCFNRCELKNIESHESQCFSNPANLEKNSINNKKSQNETKLNNGESSRNDTSTSTHVNDDNVSVNNNLNNNIYADNYDISSNSQQIYSNNYYANYTNHDYHLNTHSHSHSHYPVNSTFSSQNPPNNRTSHSYSNISENNLIGDSYSHYLFPTNSTLLSHNQAINVYYKIVSSTTTALFRSDEWQSLTNDQNDTSIRNFWKVMKIKIRSAYNQLNDQLGEIHDEFARVKTCTRMTQRLLRKWEFLGKKDLRYLKLKLKFTTDETLGFMHFKAVFVLRQE